MVKADVKQDGNSDHKEAHCRPLRNTAFGMRDKADSLLSRPKNKNMK